jgi:hypothetical protein
MANRNFKPGARCLEAGTVKLYGEFTTSSFSGVIGSQDCQGFRVTNGSAGEYQIILEDNYLGLRNLDTKVIFATASGGNVGQDSQILNDDVVNGIIDIVFLSGDNGVADDLPDGAKVLIEITLKNSTVAY